MPHNPQLLDPVNAERFIKEQFRENHPRLEHILIVADRVRQSARDINELQPGVYLSERLAYCAGLVHDIGYLADAFRSGFHPLDGHDYLAKLGFPQLAELIVGHSSAPEEAKLLGLKLVCTSSHPIAELVTYWDMRVKQGGTVVSFDERVADILNCHGGESVVGKAILIARPRLITLSLRVESLLGR